MARCCTVNKLHYDILDLSSLRIKHTSVICKNNLFKNICMSFNIGFDLEHDLTVTP